MNNKNNHMKWNGWGDTTKKFNMDDKPELWPYIKKITGLRDDSPLTYPVDLTDIVIPPSEMDPDMLAVLMENFQPHQIKTNDYERLIHCYGKSYRDLFRVRKGIIDSAPDCICYPESEQDVVNIINLAKEHHFVLIPFGGGSNIVGCVEAIDTEDRMVVTLDMRRMNRVMSVDKMSQIACIQAGALGPILEEQLNQAGMTLGHFPDSFEYSTLGGWIATRSAGMQSDKYGKIEDMVLSLRMVTPEGIIVTKSVPKASNGIDVNHLCIGSEGILGVIVEATMRVHALPECKEFYGYLFPDFASGIAAIYECERKGCMPVITRLNDPDKTALSFAYKTKETPFRQMLSKLVKGYLKNVKKMDFSQVCLMITAFEGDKHSVKAHVQRVTSIYKKHGAFCLGAKPGQAFEKGKYDFPYLRDYVMDYGLIADVSETATSWSNLLPLYQRTREAVLDAMKTTGAMPWCGCHVSHNYHTGASLYFTFACQQTSPDGLEQYLFIKKAAEDAFIQHGGCLSHHHAVGYEHLPWLEHDLSSTGLKAVLALKNGLDSENIMNPGKLVVMSESTEEEPEDVAEEEADVEDEFEDDVEVEDEDEMEEEEEMLM